MKLSYRHTIRTCYLGYVVGAIVNNLTPLLLTTFAAEFSLSVTQLGTLVVLNFAIQMFIDFTGAYIAEKTGYRAAIVSAQLFAAAGLIGLGVLPYVMQDKWTAILLALVLYAVGGGMIEVLVSPITEAVPGEDKPSNMAVLHSFFCWGSVAVIFVSTGYFAVFGSENWRWLAIAWAVVPLAAAALFALVPIKVFAEDVQKAPIKKLLTSKIFLILVLLMICSGASEVAMSQWASMFAENELHITKAAGDILGPCMFAALMGLSRVIYSKFGKRADITKLILFSGIVCACSYLIAALSPYSYLSVAGCALCGLSVGVLWPGTLSLAAADYPQGGTPMFGFLAFGGDIGCLIGPGLVTVVASLSGDSIKTGILSAAVFPIVMTLIAAVMLAERKRAR